MTERFLLPAVSSLEALFLALRAQLDPELSQAKPVKHGKTYPLGQCLEISLAMKARLGQLDPSSLKGTSLQGHAALTAFLRHGGRLRQVWGDLRGEYFQNAFLAGTLYIDVSNDTVVRTKPPVEILPLPDARFTPVEDYAHYARTASRYWGAHVFPNHVAPALAPYFPLITATPGGNVRFQACYDYMIALTERGEFRPGEAVLHVPPMKEDLFRMLAPCLAGSSFGVAADPVQGQALALQYCRKYRDERWHHSGQQRTLAVKAVLEANQRLNHLRLQLA